MVLSRVTFDDSSTEASSAVPRVFRGTGEIRMGLDVNVADLTYTGAIAGRQRRGMVSSTSVINAQAMIVVGTISHCQPCDAPNATELFSA